MRLIKTALITGSKRGIGRGIAEALAAQKYSLIINGVGDEQSAHEALESCRAHGAHSVVYCQADIGEKDGRDRLYACVKNTAGRLDMLVNNAGVAPSVRKDILEAGEDSFDRLIRINLKGPFFFTQAVARHMIDHRQKDPDYYPSIVNVGSISAYTSSPSRPEYCISKAGFSMMSTLFADRLAAYGINVYEIRPGVIATDMTSGVKEKYDALIAEGLTPIPRWGQPADIGKAVVAIGEGLLPFSTGEVINVDGGFHMRRL
jgi:NAD(P)-dependent dehydrogenase (short-subunit alcohol dehydrogenase family)